MNTKIPLKQLAETVAETTGVSVETAQSFIKSYFSEIADRLLNGEIVRVEKLGDFGTSPNPEDPVVFAPDPELAADINAPFAMFEALTIDDPGSEEILKTIDEAEPEPENADTMVADEPQDTVEPDQSEHSPADTCEVKETVSPCPIVADDADIAVDPIMSEPLLPEEPASADDPVEHPEQQETPQDPVCVADCESSAKESSDAEADVEEKISEAIEESEQESPTSDVQETECAQETEIEIIEEPTDSDNPADNDDEEAETPMITIIPEDDEEFVAVDKKPATRFWTGFTIGLLTGLLIGALALSAYVICLINGKQIF